MWDPQRLPRFSFLNYSFKASCGLVGQVVGWEDVHTELAFLGNTSHKKKPFLSGIAQITSPPSPNLGKLVLFFGRQNDVFARITEPSNDDYDNDVIIILVLLMILVLKMTKKYHIT